MSGVAGLRGVSAQQDGRFSDKTKQLKSKLKFPKQLDVKIDFSKVNLEVIREWIAKRVTALLNGVEDDVLIGYIFELLEQKEKLDPKELQLYLTGFLEKNTGLFMKELWTLLVQAQNSPSGIPQQILDLKAEELQHKQMYQDKIKAQLNSRQQLESNVDADKAKAQDKNQSKSKAAAAVREEKEDEGERRRKGGSFRESQGIRNRRYNEYEEETGKDSYKRSRSPSPIRKTSERERERGRGRDRGRDREWERSSTRQHYFSRNYSRWDNQVRRSASPVHRKRYRSKSPSPRRRISDSSSSPPRHKSKSPSPAQRRISSYSSPSPRRRSHSPKQKENLQKDNLQRASSYQPDMLDTEMLRQSVSKLDTGHASPVVQQDLPQPSMSPVTVASGGGPQRENAPSPSTDRDRKRQEAEKKLDKKEVEIDDRQKKEGDDNGVDKVVDAKQAEKKSRKEEKAKKKKHKKDKKSKHKKRRHRSSDEEDENEPRRKKRHVSSSEDDSDIDRYRRDQRKVNKFEYEYDRYNSRIDRRDNPSKFDYDRYRSTEYRNSSFGYRGGEYKSTEYKGAASFREENLPNHLRKNISDSSRRDIKDIVQEMKSIVEVEDLEALRQKALRGVSRDE